MGQTFIHFVLTVGVRKWALWVVGAQKTSSLLRKNRRGWGQSASDPLPKQHQLNKSPERELRALKTVV